jgi:hypothetical protein
MFVCEFSGLEKEISEKASFLISIANLLGLFSSYLENHQIKARIVVTMTSSQIFVKSLNDEVN